MDLTGAVRARFLDEAFKSIQDLKVGAVDCLAVINHDERLSGFRCYTLRAQKNESDLKLLPQLRRTPEPS